MADFKKGAPHIPVVLAFLIFWASFAWGLPAEAPAGEAGTGELSARSVCKQCGFVTEGDAKFCPICGKRLKVGVEDPWAGVKISGAYGYAKCLNCSFKNDVRAGRCLRCGSELPQPLKEFKYPPWVLVPGEGYYREGTLLEPAKTTKALWIPGLFVTALGVALTANRFSIAAENPTGKHMFEIVAGISVTALGVAFMVFGFKKSDPVYAFVGGETHGFYEGVAFALRSPDSDGIRLKVELTALAF